jgi:Holliday junction resolvase
MSRYAVGRRLEWRVRRLLEEQGYFVVRSAGSRGRADLIAVILIPQED